MMNPQQPLFASVQPLWSGSVAANSARDWNMYRLLWLIEQAPSYDLVCIAGDLLDMFKFESSAGTAASGQTAPPGMKKNARTPSTCVPEQLPAHVESPKEYMLSSE